MSNRHNFSGSFPAIYDRAHDRRVWVIGDLMLDEYIEGVVTRLSPEATIPVLSASGRSFAPGGAANVARAIAALGLRVCLGGTVGADENGRRLLSCCKEHGIDVDAVVTDTERVTTHKVRVTTSEHPVVRIDWEDTHSISDSISTEILSNLRTWGKPDAIVVSDYRKGVLTSTLCKQIINVDRGAIPPVLVDPKGTNLNYYRGATVVTPNLAEFIRLCGEETDRSDDGQFTGILGNLCQHAGVSAMLVTMGADGMALWSAESGLMRLPAATRKAIDVTGAGDTVVATLAFALLGGTSLQQAASMANAAAGIVVTKKGTAVVSPDELATAWSEPSASSIQSKIINRNTLSKLLNQWRSEKKTIAFTNGCFDILHAGHVDLLVRAANEGDVLVVGLNTDDSIRRLGKGNGRPFVNERDRALLLAALECVSVVVLFSDDTPLDLINLVQPDVLIKGADYELEDIVGQELVVSRGGKAMRVDLVPERSTTRLLDRIRSGERYE